jgi:hypothetical protein
MSFSFKRCCARLKSSSALRGVCPLAAAKIAARKIRGRKILPASVKRAMASPRLNAQAL